MREEFDMQSHLLRACLLAMITACASCSGKKDAVDANTSAPQAASPAQGNVAESPEEARDNIGDRVDQLVAEAAKLPRAEFEPAALAALLGKDPQRHFEWVRDRTSWAPYRGLLRGSQGVMLDRVGSNLDRAILLGDLLRRAGHTVRLVHANLSEDDARKLLGKLRPMPEQRAANASNERDAGKNVEKQLAVAKRTEEKAESLIQAQTQTILAALKDAVGTDEATDGEELAALRDHWWVEREENGKWIPLDVLLPDAKPGVVLASATSTSAWSAAETAPSIPDSEWHTVKMRVKLERYVAGVTTESTLLEASLRPAETLGRPLRLSHIPVPWPDELETSDVNLHPFREAALAVKMWFPVLRVGEDQIVQTGFTEKGDLRPEFAESMNQGGTLGGADSVSRMDMALGGFGANEITPAATAEWIDYEITVPGSPTQRLRRSVFDLLGPARRTNKATDFDGTAELNRLERFEALWAQIDILLQTSDYTGPFVAHLHSADLVSNQKALEDLAREENVAKLQSMATEILGRIEIWGALPSYVLWRSNLGAQASESFIDRPNVLHYRVGPAVVKAERGVVRELIDVAANPTGVRRHSASNAFKVRVGQGVADTVAEILALGADVGTAENTASVFGRLPADNNRGMLIAAGDEAAALALPWPEDEIARVAADVNAGYIVLVPRQAVVIHDRQRVGWWRVDPASGETIGVMDTGYHQALTEDQLNRAEDQRRRLLDWRLRQDHDRMGALRSRLNRNRPISDSARDELELYELSDRMLTMLWNLRYL